MSKTKLSKKHKIKVDGEIREIFMSYGLLSKVCGLIGSPDNIPLLLVDSELRNSLLEVMLVERDEDGEIKKYYSADKIDVEPEDVAALVFWATEHALDFFMKGAALVKDIFGKYKELIPNLQSSSDGSEA